MKTVLVPGASSGIGRATALRLAKEGGPPRRRRARWEDRLAELASTGWPNWPRPAGRTGLGRRQVETRRPDVADRADVAEFADRRRGVR